MMITPSLHDLDAQALADYVSETLNGDRSQVYRDELRSESLRESEARLPHGLDRKIALVGGAGYIGTVATRHLLERGYRVKCIDNLVYSHYFTVLPFLTNRNYEFSAVDLCDTETAARAMGDCTDVVLLAGLVGDPITKKYPNESAAVNDAGLRNLINKLARNTRLNKLVFVSTCSNYGLIESDELADEDHELNPLSLYAKSKVAMEKALLDALESTPTNATVLRFATAFGYSPRMRFDLTVNEFTRDLRLGKELVVFDADTWRPYCHVEDFADLIRRVLEAPKERVRQKIFNAGSESNNFTKRMIVDAVLARVPAGKVVFQEKGSDPRNYKVDFSRVRKALEFDAGFSVADGIDELVQILNLGFFQDDQVAGNSWFGNYDIANKQQ